MKDNSFNWLLFILGIFAGLIISGFFSTKSYNREQIEKIEILIEEVHSLKCSVDSLENYLCD